MDDTDEIEEIQNAEEKAKYESLKAVLLDRAKVSSLETSITDFGDGDEAIMVMMPEARNSRPFYIFDANGIENFLAVSFEEFRYLEDYQAIVNYSKGYIEAGIRANRNVASGGLNRILRYLQEQTDLGSSIDITLDAPSIEKPSLRLCSPSPEFDTLAQQRGITLTIRLEMFGIVNHDQAKALLVRYANSLFFQIDFLTDLPLSLMRYRISTARRRITRRERHTLQYPTMEYDDAPSSLYWYGRSADAMPLLQFLAFYQVVEYFFPIHSQSEAQRRVRHILKNPAFRIDKDSDISAIVSTIQSTKSGGFFDERTQLRATIIECLESDQIRAFIEAEPNRLEFFQKDYKKVDDAKISLSNKTADLRNEVAERIYAIRCKIVNTKQSDTGGKIELLLPYSKQEDSLGFDIDLMGFVAKTVIVASGSMIS